MFHMNFAKVDPNVAHVAMVIHVCCKSLFKMFHMFQTYVASALSIYCLYCNGYVACVCSKMFYLFQMYIAIVLSECCKSISRYRVVERGRES